MRLENALDLSFESDHSDMYPRIYLCHPRFSTRPVII